MVELVSMSLNLDSLLLAGVVLSPLSDKLDRLRFIGLELGTTGAGFGLSPGKATS
jgi:hypothetical protein